MCPEVADEAYLGEEASPTGGQKWMGVVLLALALCAARFCSALVCLCHLPIK